MRIVLAFLATAGLLSGPALAAETAAHVELSIGGNAETRTVTYDCEGISSFDVQYINAAPNFLAIIPVQEETYIFTAVLAASGVRYVAGNFVWWTKGSDADWYDLTKGDDAPPDFSCSEHNQTP
jgi:membrane-bound inhibitor of C-type lysozyme